MCTTFGAVAAHAAVRAKGVKCVQLLTFVPVAIVADLHFVHQRIHSLYQPACHDCELELSR
jgi:hypothetical protein